MSLVTERFNHAFRESKTAGLPLTGINDVVKAEVREIGPVIDSLIAALSLGGAITVSKETLALLEADLAADADELGIVYGDVVPANNGLYLKDGATGLGEWIFLSPIGMGITEELVAELEANIAATTGRVQTVEGQVAGLANLPPTIVGDRSIQPWIITYDARILLGFDVETLALFDPLDIFGVAGAAEAVEKTSGIVRLGITTHLGRPLAPEFLDYEGRVARGIWLDTMETFAPLDTPAGPYRERQFATFAGGPTDELSTYPALFTPINGQSNGNGSSDQNVLPVAIHTNAPYSDRVVTFVGGPKANPADYVTSMASLKPLVEDTVDGDGAGQGSTYAGETAVWSMCYGLMDALYEIVGGSPDLLHLPAILGHTSAFGGANITALRTTHYARFTRSLTEGYTLLTAEYGAGAVVPYVYIDHGEGDQGVGTTAAYVSGFGTFAGQVVASVLATFPAQDFDPPIFIVQKSWATGYALNADLPSQAPGASIPNAYPNSVTKAALELEGDGIFIAFPDYCLPFSFDTIHREAYAHPLAGILVTRAAKRVLVDRQDWRCTRLQSCVWEGRVGRVSIAAPIEPIAFDFSLVGAVEQFGFAVEDDDGLVPLVAVSCHDGSRVRLEAERDLVIADQENAPAVVRYAYDFAVPGNLAGAGGNLRDSDISYATVDGVTYRLANYCLHGEVPILFKE